MAIRDLRRRSLANSAAGWTACGTYCRVLLNREHSKEYSLSLDNQHHIMEIDLSKLSITNNEAAGRFEATLENHTAFIRYRRADDRLVFIHTEVPAELEGHGIAARLSHAALEFAREGHFKVVPFCPFVAGYIRKHSEYHDLLSAEDRRDLLSK
jgi:uncharacterized protein